MLHSIHDHIRQMAESIDQLTQVEIDYDRLETDYEAEYDRCIALAEALNETERGLLRADLKAWRVRRGEDDIEWFGRYYFPEYFENESPAFHQELDDIVEEAEANKDKHSGLILAAPRGHAKSFRISFLKVIHRIVYKKKKFVVLISDTGTQAESMTSAIKVEFEENDQLREDFGDLVGDTYGLKWTTGDFYVTFPKVDAAGKNETNKKGKLRPGHTCRVVARGTNAGMRGLKNRAYRPDLVIVDDGENDELVLTPAQRKKVWNWLTGSVIPMLHPTEGLFIVVGTVLHYDSMLSRLLAQPDIYLIKRYKAILDDGQPLWPSRFPLNVLLKKKQQLGTLKFNQEYMNDPHDEDAQSFQAGWLRFYTKNEISFSEDTWWILGERMTLYQGVDPAISQKESADDFVICTTGFSEQNKIVLLDPYDAHLDFTSQPKMIIKKYQEWLPARVGIETNAYQEALKQQTVKDAHIPVKGLHHSGDKYTRIMTMSPFFENGQFYIREALDDEPFFMDMVRLPGKRIHLKFQKFYEQLLQYSASAAKDDLLDGLENCFALAKPKMVHNEYYQYPDEAGVVIPLERSG